MKFKVLFLFVCCVQFLELSGADQTSQPSHQLPDIDSFVPPPNREIIAVDDAEFTPCDVKPGEEFFVSDHKGGFRPAGCRNHTCIKCKWYEVTLPNQFCERRCVPSWSACTGTPFFKECNSIVAPCLDFKRHLSSFVVLCRRCL
ncbi:hypothetical protein M3Y97_01128400 [Aphelenchoides bicaudatus]|nr:hypothetical protein M3Y97_01128400 [Aphelenchoides bicaudatus]